MELEMYLDILKRRWHIAVLVAFIVICLGALGSTLISQKYQAKAMLRVVTPVGGSSRDTNYQTTFANRLVNTYVQIATSEQLMIDLKKKLGVKDLPDITVSLIPDSEIIQILVESSSPARAAETANALAEMLVSYQDTSVSSMDSKELSLLKDRVESSKTELARYKQEHDRLAQSYSETTSEMNVLDRKIRLKEGSYQNVVTEYEMVVADVAGRTGGATAQQRDALASGIDAMEKELDALHLQFKDLSVEANNYLQQITLLRLSIQNAENTYSNLLDQYDAVQLAHLKQESAQKIIIVSPAVEPLRPSGFGRSFVLGLGILVGIIAGVGVAFVFNSLDSRIYSAEQIGRLTSIQTVGVISKYNRKLQNLNTNSDPMVDRDYWMLRSRLQALMQEGSLKTIMLTSPNRSEGKSTITYKLSLGFAQSGFKVLVVDADMRMGKQHQNFKVTGEKGLFDYLSGEQNTVKGLILKTVRPGIDLLPSPIACDDPTELFQSPRLKALLDSLNGYDLVLFDTPAFLAVPDALTLSRNVDGVLVIVRYGHTKGSDVQTTCQHLASVGPRILGMVVNQVPVKKDSNPYQPRTKQSHRQTSEAMAS